MFFDDPPPPRNDDDSVGTALLIGLGCVAVYCVAKTLVPDQVHYEDDSIHIFGVPVAGKKSVIVDWLS